MENRLHQYHPSLVTAATLTNKSENQDSHAVYEGPGQNAVFIADGLGGPEFSKFARRSSDRVTAYFHRETCGMDTPVTSVDKLERLFRDAQIDLSGYAREICMDETDGEPGKDLFGTTAIAVFEDQDKIRMAYTGNGAIWHIRPNLRYFSAVQHIPWNAVNLLSPHSIPENGKDVLSRLISNYQDAAAATPSILEIVKDRNAGDIIMVCTDGIHSSDQLRIGQNTSGIWYQCNPVLLQFFEHLQRYAENKGNFTKQSLSDMLNAFLFDVKHLLQDDATIGMLVTAAAINQFEH